MTQDADEILLARFRSGDSQALEAICLRYEGPLFQFLVGLLRDHHQAEDALQETLVRALERLDAVDPAHLRGWLFTVAYHQAMLFRRRQKCRRVANVPMANALTDPAPGPCSLAEQRDDVRRLRALLELLPAGQREVIRQRVYEGKRFREIAEALGCPLNTALARMREGLKRLRLLWEQSHA
ncbi:MAG: sigma-70 family RNA polymerase sigma factor [Gemmataceae bacterium]|nr:sigma-70 family RNA polymerase sigma factor [Gemmataceae bacterium]MDW8263758.1 sigma-70 family RNA polymerase sigma factor [Gemmataceae bacterium]